MAWMGATEKLPLNFVLKRDVIAPIAGRSFLNINSVRAVLGGLYVHALTKSLRRAKYSTTVGVPDVSVFAGLGID